MRVLSVILAIPAVYAWGSTGHSLTGQLAQKLMKPATADKLANILPAEYNGDVGQAALWADQVKRTRGYTWSAILHFSDAQDDPPTSCSYDYARDCPDGKCVVGAIANYTQRVGCDNSASAREEAAKFIAHFMGDITQPLHLCARDKGGNDNKIEFDTRSTNFHAIWDTNMLEKKMKEDFGSSQAQYLDYLLKLATTDKDASDWTSCMDASDDVALSCPTAWASDSDEMNCSAVWPAYDEDSSQNFGGEYYTNNIAVAERQVAKAGVRMAAWFDKFVGEANCLTDETDTEESDTEQAFGAGGKTGWLYY